MGHVGLLPQSVNTLGGYNARGRDAEEADRILQGAQAVAAAGAFSMVIEGTLEPLARRITEAVPVPTIGIGASVGCDGQVLVTEDMLGMTGTRTATVRAPLCRPRPRHRQCRRGLYGRRSRAPLPRAGTCLHAEIRGLT